MAIKRYEGKLEAAGLKVGIVVSRFNSFLTDKLLEGALDCIRRHGGADDDVSVAYVPGSFEIPYVASKMARAGGYDAVVCLGALVRGDTPHFDYIAAEATKGVAKAAIDTGLPVVYGIITADTLEQAIERSGTKAGNKGWQAAEAAIEMASLYRAMQ